MSETRAGKAKTTFRRDRPSGWRALFDFGPDAGVHAYLGADLIVLTIASFLTILYVWVDEPGPSDLGRHTLSGLLVAVFGPRFARLGGMAVFTGISVALLWAVIAYMRWASGPRLARRRMREARRAERLASRSGTSSKPT